jgi:NAD dependent epimerase/dehydratase family
MAKIRVMITGATGMVGEGAMLECLKHPDVERVLLVSRKPYPAEHAKLKQCLVPDFMDLAAVTEQLQGYDACFFCAGVSSLGMSEEQYSRISYDLTLNFAKTVAAGGQPMVFIYVSGASTDSTEQGKSMWARVKGRTENALLKVGFKAAYNFRPGFMKPTPGQKNVLRLYSFLAWLYWPLRVLTPNLVSTMSDVGLAMINAVLYGYPKSTLEVKDINALAKLKP